MKSYWLSPRLQAQPLANIRIASRESRWKVRVVAVEFGLPDRFLSHLPSTANAIEVSSHSRANELIEIFVNIHI